MSKPERKTVDLPDLGAGDVPVRLVQWLVEPGAPLAVGERMAEVVVGGVLFHVESQISGMILEHLVERDALLSAGQPLCVVEPDEDAEE
ncbi:lipoyl domain-containing protein [Maioricimonas rarisocia]|uniref:lipoyl domain-containing protein n=1 Tax=Maioricimonas rarisocia TaxID=2528026 RepID=UPI0018D21925|nr:lipoyl domain-containing protein [Maioricimonas rarisocia]